jgi:flagellar biosynthetic protein FliR
MAIPDPIPFLLVLARVAGLVLAAPVLGHLLVPLRVRAGLVIVLAGVLAPLAPPVATPGDPWTLAGTIASESALGVLLGLVAQFVFAGVQLGGQLAGTHMGFGVANLIDPQLGQQVTVIAEWQLFLTLLAFLMLDVHHLLIRGLVASFAAAPPGSLVLAPIDAARVVSLAGELFVIAVRVAAPVLAVLLFTNAALGVLAKSIPQLNVFVVGFPLNVGVGLVVLGASLPFTLRLVAERFAGLDATLGGLVRGLVHG